ncbi:uncharacterized protein [Asterias amurensis]|uniref:uncharacterized protein n=1 Tax=Asterias amurensis TaxID=7602 RepID=UPI003AB49593
MASAWQTDGECHFTWNLEENPVVIKTADKILRKIQNNLAETDFLGIGHLLFKACLQVWFKDVTDAFVSLDKAKQEIEKRRGEDEYKGYKSVEHLNRMWIENTILSNSQKLCELHEELKTIQLEEKDLRVVGAVKAAALMRLGPVMCDTNLALFKAAHQAFPSNPDFLFGVAFITGQKMRFVRPIGSRYYHRMDQIGKTLMDEEKGYWETLNDMILPDKRSCLVKSMLGWNLSRRDRRREKREALELLELAYKEAPEIHQVCRNLVRFKRKPDPDGSITILKRAISRQPDRTENHHQLALCYIQKYAEKKGNEWNKKALEELDKCLSMDSLHGHASLNKAKLLKDVPNGNPEEVYINIVYKMKDNTPDDKLKIYEDFASFLNENKTASRYNDRFDMWQEVMNIFTEHFGHQNESGKWEATLKANDSKTKAYKVLEEHYEGQADHLKLGILFYQNYEFDQAIDMLATVDQTNAEVPYYLAKSYLKKGQEKTVGDQASPEEAAGDFTRAREKVELVRESGLEQEKVREILADTALAIAHNELQANANDVIQLEDRCVTSYREAVRCGSLVAGLELMKLAKSDVIDTSSSSMSKFIQMLAEIKVCCSQSQSDALHAESKPLTFEGGLRSKETAIEPCMLRNRTKIKDELKGILSKETFFQKAWKGLFKMEVKLLKERFGGTDGHGLDGREEASPLEGVTDDVIDKAVGCCCDTRPLLDRVMEKFMKDELDIATVKNNYFPLILDENLTPEKTKESLLEKLKICKVDMRTHYPKLYDYLLKLQPKISPGNTFMKNFCTIVNKTKHTSEDVLDIEPYPVELARQSTDKVEEICQVFFDTMEEAKVLRTRVKDLVSAIRQGGGEEVEKADELFGILMKNEDFVIRLDNTWKYLGTLALINHSREKAGTDVDLTRWTELSERNSGFSQDLRKGYLEVEAALLTNNGDQSSMEVLEECHKTCLEADKLLNRSLQSEENLYPTFPFLDKCPVENKQSWEGNVKKQLKSKKLLSQKISDDKKLLDIILQAQPCSNEDNYRFIAMRKFLDDRSRKIFKDTVSIEKGTNPTESYGILDLTRWCVNHAEKLASKVKGITQP